MSENIIVDKLDTPEGRATLKDYLLRIADDGEVIYTESAPNGSISARRGKIAIYKNGSAYEQWQNMDGATTWQRIDSGASIPLTYIDTDGTLAANSDVKVASQKATKTYADTKIPKTDIDTSTSLGTSDTKVPSQNAVKAYVDARPDTNFSNILFSWVGIDIGTTNTVGKVEGTNLTPAISTYTINYEFMGVYSDTYRTILSGKFKKFAGVSTITINAKIWGLTTNPCVLKADVGGANNTVTRSVSSPGWATVSTIDVSGLTNGTTYDITIQLKAETAESAYCSAITLMGS